MQNPPPDAGGTPLYRVSRVEDSTMLGQTGGFQRSKRVYFVIPDGSSSYVEVPLSGFTKATVEALINQHLDQLLDVLTIQGPTVPQQPT